MENHKFDEVFSDGADNIQGKEPQDVPLPDPTLLSLVSGLAAQAMISMGIFPNPASGKVSMLLNQAQHLIGTIAMLDEKTKGNQSDEETKTISNALHELRMIFVAAQKEKVRQDAESNSPKPNDEPTQKDQQEK